tara:strand:- start:153 stop:419 length:267 start_codon:yes stop_codon:yes gene_type:complete
VDERKYQIFCQIDGRLVAFLSMAGELTVCHEHFNDEDEFEIEQFIEALDKWHTRRTVYHRSKKGVNRKAFEAVNELQQQKPGSVLLES